MIITCKYCKTEHDIPIKPEDYEKWQESRGYIQDVADYLRHGKEKCLYLKLVMTVGKECSEQTRMLKYTFN